MFQLKSKKSQVAKLPDKYAKTSCQAWTPRVDQPALHFVDEIAVMTQQGKVIVYPFQELHIYLLTKGTLESLDELLSLLFLETESVQQATIFSTYP